MKTLKVYNVPEVLQTRFVLTSEVVGEFFKKLNKTEEDVKAIISGDNTVEFMVNHDYTEYDGRHYLSLDGLHKLSEEWMGLASDETRIRVAKRIDHMFLQPIYPPSTQNLQPVAATAFIKTTPVPVVPTPQPSPFQEIKFFWQGADQCFRKEANGMYNLTEVWKAFCGDTVIDAKSPGQWSRQTRSKELIAALDKRHVDSHDASDSTTYVVKRGGDMQGTWGSFQVLQHFLQWLSIDYSILVGEAIEAIAKGETAHDVQNVVPQSYAEALMAAGTMAKQIEDDKPLTDLGYVVADTSKGESSGTVAGAYNLTSQQLNLIMLGLHVFKRSGGGYVLTAKYMSSGIGTVKLKPYGETDPKIKPYVWYTGEGVKFVNTTLSRITGFDCKEDADKMQQLRTNPDIVAAVNVGRRVKESSDSATRGERPASNLVLELGDIVRVPSDVNRDKDWKASFDGEVIDKAGFDGMLEVRSIIEGVEEEDQALFNVVASTVTLVAKAAGK